MYNRIARNGQSQTVVDNIWWNIDNEEAFSDCHIKSMNRKQVVSFETFEEDELNNAETEFTLSDKDVICFGELYYRCVGRG
jgi:hypothetical protein